MEQDLLTKLSDHNLRKTPFRRRILQIFIESKGFALTNRDIEENLGDFDRITLYRTLKSFEQHGLIHQVIDGTGTPKYALCSDVCTEYNHRDVHAHFFCTDCEQTTCLEDISVPEPNLSKGFRIHAAQLVLNGVCDVCTRAIN